MLLSPNYEEFSMQITYCEHCGGIVKVPKAGRASAPALCSACLSGARKGAVKRRKLRESDAIPRSKVTEALKLDGKKPPQA